MVLFGPIEVDSASSHRLERAFHADCTNIDMAEHGGDKQHGDDAVRDLRPLHARDVGPIEWENQHVSARCHRGAAKYDDPIDSFLTRVKSIGRWMVVANDAAAAFEPFDIHAV